MTTQVRKNGKKSLIHMILHFFPELVSMIRNWNQATLFRNCKFHLNAHNTSQAMKKEKNNSARNIVNSISFVKLILGIDLFIILCTLIQHNNHYLIDNVILNWVIPKFDLAVEMNFAVWWSSLLLFLIGFLSYQKFLLEGEDTQKAWIGISIIFMGLSIDEICSLHERIGNWLGYFPFALACFLILIYSLQILFFRNESRYAAILISLAFALFAFTAFQEYLEFTLNWPSWAFGPRIIIEEGTELAGSLLGLIGVVGYPKRKHMRQLRNLLPKTSTIERCKNLLFIFLVIHFILSMTIFSWSNLKELGNPIVCYPMIVYFLLFIYSLQKLLKESTNNHYLSLMLTVSFLFCSALIPYVFTISFDLSLSSEIWIFDATLLISFLTLFHALQLFICVCLFFNYLSSTNLGKIFVILVFISILIGLIFSRNLVLVFILIGFSSYIYYYLIVIKHLAIKEK